MNIEPQNSYEYKIKAVNGFNYSISDASAVVTTTLSDSLRVIRDVTALTFDMIKLENSAENNITGDLNLTKVGLNGSVIVWRSSSNSIDVDSGKVDRTALDSDLNVSLEAFVKYGESNDTVKFNLVFKKIDVIDTDGDGIPDNEDLDDDGDGISDTDELKYGLNPKDSSDATQDSDHDGVSNIDEIKAGTNPLVSDLNPITITTEQNVYVYQGEEYNLSLDINHSQKQNLDILLLTLDDIEHNNSIFSLTPNWTEFEPIAWEEYRKQKLSVMIKGETVGERNMTIVVSDEDNEQLNKDVHVSVVAKSYNSISLKRTGWNLVSICQNMNKDEIDMTNIEEIQAQNGHTLYTGDFADYSNLDELKAGYGYWVKAKKGVLFNVGKATNKLVQPLTRTGWNLMAMCEDISKEEVAMEGIKEIQAQNGNSIYTGDFESYSNLNSLIMGYGYWVKGDEGTPFISKRGLSLPTGFDYQTINNSNEIVETTLGDLTIKLYANYEEIANDQQNHVGIAVKVDGANTPLLLIQGSYVGHPIVVAVYDSSDKLIGLSEITTISGNSEIEVTTQP